MHDHDDFHPLTDAWFAAHIGQPTDIQRQAWPRIAAGEHVLAVAPTGSGKTLTAFLAALDALANGKWPTGRVSVVYVSPLKALGNDVRRNLIAPLAGLRRAYEAAGKTFPEIRVAIRTGDTPPEERRRMLRRPPEILITTPESLNLLLSSRGGRSLLPDVRLVILDEIHAVAGSKRGVFLLVAVERLAFLAGEFQRVALSATVAPLATVAAMVGGFRLADGSHAPRPVAVVVGRDVKRTDIRVHHTPWPEGEERPSQLRALAGDIRRRILANRTTLIFVNSRKLCEKLARFINDDPDGGPGELLAHAHHGSLAKELRSAVEARLKAGELRAVVATMSLELGIDIGNVDEVLLVECPPTVSSALQRLGRSGHKVGEASRAVFLPTSDRDLLEAAVMAKAAATRDIEDVRPVLAPLDVLAQTLVAMLGVESWEVDALYDAVRCAWPYRELSRKAFDLTMAMLTGRYAETRIRELSPLVAVDGLTGTATARAGALMRLYASGGVIADRGYFTLRRKDSGARLGELDEVFVWEARLGQLFAFGAQNWRIERITDADVFVSPAPDGTVPAPFWIGEARSRDSHFSRLVAAFLEEADTRLDDPAFAQELSREYYLEAPAVEALLDFLRRQKAATGARLPHAHHVLVEVTDTGPGGAPGNQIILHAPLGLAVTAPWALLLQEALVGRCGEDVPVFAGNDCLVVTLPRELDPAMLPGLIPLADAETLLRARLEGSGSFGAAFREAAGRALLLPKEGFGRRTPLWINRLRARKLLAAVAGHGDFPMVLEAWRTCLADVFDLAGLRALLAALADGGVAVSVVRTKVQSPFAADLVYRHINEYMYLTDAGTAAGATGVRPDLVAEVASGATGRPCVPEAIVRQFEAKRQRVFPGYAPGSASEVLEHVKERVALPETEWRALLAAVERDHGLSGQDVETALAPKLARIVSADGAVLVAALERAPRIALAWYGDAALAVPVLPTVRKPRPPALSAEDAAALSESLLVEWLAFYGPMSFAAMGQSLGASPEILTRAAEALEASGAWIAGELVSGRTERLTCDAANFETLLRLARAARRPTLKPLAPEQVPYFLAGWQGLVQPVSDADALADRLERLACLPLGAEAWEADILPARCCGYDPAWLDAAVAATGLAWYGAGTKKVLFARPEDLDLAGFTPPESTDGLFPDPRARYDFDALLEMTGLAPAELASKLWRAAWKGEAACDALSVLRRGVATKFTPEPAFYATARHGRQILRRTRPARFAAALPAQGSWFRPRVPEPPGDPVEREALAMDRARLVVFRYGVVCADILAREAGALGWSSVFRALRRLELSGEVVAGEFFTGVSSPQFAAPEAVARLASGLSGREPWWCAAVDPVCAGRIAGPGIALPRRVAGAFVSFCGSEAVAVFEAGGKRLTVSLAPDDPGLAAALAPLDHLVGRRGSARRVAVATINGVPAGASPYLAALRQRFEVVRGQREIVVYPARSLAADTGTPNP